MPLDDRGRCTRHPSVDPGGVVHVHYGCLWATLSGSISAWSSIPWSLRFAEMIRGYRAMKPSASLPAQPATGISWYPMVHRRIVMVHCALPPWRLVLLEGRIASEASYPICPVPETSRPKALVFFPKSVHYNLAMLYCAHYRLGG